MRSNTVAQAKGASNASGIAASRCEALRPHADMHTNRSPAIVLERRRGAAILRRLMPICRKCQKTWPEGTTVCPEDGWAFAMEVDATYHPSQVGGASVAMAGSPAPRIDEPPPSSDLIPGMT